MSEKGKIIQVIGPIVDIRFAPENLPAIRNAIHIQKGKDAVMTAEVAQHVGDDVVRCIAMPETGIRTALRPEDRRPCLSDAGSRERTQGLRRPS